MAEPRPLEYLVSGGVNRISFCNIVNAGLGLIAKMYRCKKRVSRKDWSIVTDTDQIRLNGWSVRGTCYLNRDKVLSLGTVQLYRPRGRGAKGQVRPRFINGINALVGFRPRLIYMGNTLDLPIWKRRLDISDLDCPSGIFTICDNRYRRPKLACFDDVVPPISPCLQEAECTASMPTFAYIIRGGLPSFITKCKTIPRCTYVRVTKRHFAV